MVALRQISKYHRIEPCAAFFLVATKSAHKKCTQSDRSPPLVDKTRRHDNTRHTQTERETCKHASAETAGVRSKSPYGGRRVFGLIEASCCSCAHFSFRCVCFAANALVWRELPGR